MKRAQRITYGSIATIVLLIASAFTVRAVPFDLDKLKKEGQRIATKVPKKLDTSKLPKRLELKLSADLHVPKEPDSKQSVRFRLSSSTSADQLKKLRAALEQGASSSAKLKLEQVRDYVRKNKLGFDVGITSVSDKTLAQITGAKVPSKEALANLTEQAALAEAIAAEWRSSVAPQPSGAMPPKQAAGPTVAASYYSAGSSAPPANPWMDPALYPLPATCEAKGARWVSRDALPPVRDQRTCGSCWTFSSMAALEIGQAYLNGAFYDFSEQSMLDCAVSSLGYDAGTCDGGHPSDVLDFVGKYGPAEEAVAPYVSKQARCAADKLTRYTGLAHGPVTTSPKADVAKIKEAICKYGAVSALINATDAFAAYRSGVFSEPLATAAVNHAIALVGWDDSKQAWLLRNSWAVGWGEAGYAWVKYGTNGVGDYAYWSAVAPGDGGSMGQGSNFGAFYTRVPVINNTTKEALKLRVQYIAWTGRDGMRWLPQSGSWYEYNVPAGYRGALGSPFIGSVRASKILLYAESAVGSKRWTTYETTPLALVPEGGYWAPAPEKFEIAIEATAFVPTTVVPDKKAPVVTTSCATWHISRITFTASDQYEWDPGTAPDIFLESVLGKAKARSSHTLDSFVKAWDFPAAQPFVVNSGATVTLNAYDKDVVVDDPIDTIAAKLPTAFPSGRWTKKGTYGSAEFAGTCAKAKQ